MVDECLLDGPREGYDEQSACFAVESVDYMCMAGAAVAGEVVVEQ